jgi:Zn-dependent M28 family amino/carboxypeptidase
VVWLDAASPRGAGLARGRLIDPDSRATSISRPPTAAARPVSIVLHGPEARARLESPEGATFTLRLAPPITRPVTLKNVAGLLPGSDPDLKDSYIIVSAHYDHVGVGGQPGDSDHIFNGANDDASGTALMMELASALARLETRPRRSILFLALFGEEKGLLGSRYYGRHPIYPLERTVAMINLEHMGRTDDNEGEQLRRASLTGFDYSGVGAVLAQAGRATGIEIFKHPANSDSFFGRSDNQALADRGVPAHTLCTSYIFPDYHGVGDHWDKIDYDNMAQVGRAVGLGLMLLADQSEAPLWNEDNPRTKRYVAAWKKLHGIDQEEDR